MVFRCEDLLTGGFRYLFTPMDALSYFPIWYNFSPSSQSAFWRNVVPAVFLSEVVTEVLHVVLMQCRQAGKWDAESSPDLFYAVLRLYGGAMFQFLPSQTHPVGVLKYPSYSGYFSWCSHDLKTFPFGSFILGSLLKPFHTPFASLPFDCSLPLCSSEAWTQPKVRCESNRPQLHTAFPKEMGALCKLHPCPTAKKHPIF